MCDVYVLVSVFRINESNFFSAKISVIFNLNKLSATVKSLLIACLFVFRERWGITDPLTLNASTSYVKACRETIPRV